MTKRYDAIIVGAGPAGLFAAMELADKGKKVIVIEKGRSIENRKCPMKLGSPECVQCRPCNVVCGWGGAGAFRRKAHAHPGVRREPRGILRP